MWTKSYLVTGLLISGWFATGALAGWKGWAPKPGPGGTYYGTSYGGHRSTGYGGWGGGK
ncbi:MAG: hypothetical protein KF777_07390 [Planctomycetaceae bacterium]|nr:hypothetical protein [Planctomycetaceae bacterium]